MWVSTLELVITGIKGKLCSNACFYAYKGMLIGSLVGTPWGCCSACICAGARMCMCMSTHVVRHHGIRQGCQLMAKPLVTPAAGAAPPLKGAQAPLDTSACSKLKGLQPAMATLPDGCP